MNGVFKCLMVVVRDGGISGGSGVFEGRVISKRLWGFVLVVGEVHDGNLFV